MRSLLRVIGLVPVLGMLAACTSSTSPPPAGEQPPTTPNPTTDDGSSGSTGSSGQTPPTTGTKLPDGWGATQCKAPAAAAGFEVGNSLGKLEVIDCDTGAKASIDDVCGASATWIFAAHTHCPTCQATAGFTDDIAAAVKSKNVAIVQLVYNDNGTSCAKWKAAYKLAGIEHVRVYEDPEGAGFEKLRSSNYTAASVFLDKDRVIHHKEHNLSKSEVLTQIDAALAKQ